MAEFKEEAVALVQDQDYYVAKAAEAVGVTPAMRYKWEEKQEAEVAPARLYQKMSDQH